MITFKINGQEVQGEEGQYILQVAEKYGIEIPTLCHHRVLEPAGMCRLCTVEVREGNWSNFVTACNYPIWSGMEVHTDSELVISGRTMILELLLARTPDVPVIKQLAEKYGVKEPRFTKEDDDCIMCGLCTRICDKMGSGAISLTGRGTEIKVDTPFGFKSEVCLACGACVFMCPTGHISLDKLQERVTTHKIEPILSEFDKGLQGRKPIHLPYPQAIPSVPTIDRENCVHFKTGGCQACVEVCEVNAIEHAQKDESVEIDVGAIILTPGFQTFDPAKLDNYIYSKHPNVVTSIEFERILSASGPTGGHLIRFSDHKEPKKIAWFQCVGSRDENRCENAHCSAVCCMYAIKEAVIAKDHGDGLECSVFYMDMRTHGKDFEKFYDDAKNKHGVRFVRSRVHTIDPAPDSDDLEVRYVTEEGEIQKEVFDMVVLSVGLEISPELKEFGEMVGVDLTQGNFCKTSSLDPVSTSRPGIFVAGAFEGPKDIPQAVVDSSAAAAAAAELLSSARNTLTRTKEVVPEIDVGGERPRIGIFVCHCGINIAGVVNISSVKEYAATLPYVEYVGDNLYSCSQDSQTGMMEIIKENNLNRIVVAACTPKTHEPLFQDTLMDAGLNKYLFEMVNIRNHGSWVHKAEPEMTTQKAKDLLRMGVAKVGLKEPLKEATLNVNQTALVAGGGMSGMANALSLANQGYATHIIEREGRLGGQAHNLYKTWRGESIQQMLAWLIEEVEKQDNITVHLNSDITNVEGFVGNFKSTVSSGGEERVIEHGVATIATGARQYEPTEYQYGNDSRILSTQELDKKFISDDPSLKEVNTAVFIQCVGSREPERPYCSRVCCAHSMDSALELKKRNENMNIFVLYRDIRTYGEKERLYKEARDAGVYFIRYSVDDKPQVELKDGKLLVTVKDHVLQRPLEIETDMLTLASAIVANAEESLAQFFKVPLNDNGFFVERHAKLGPSEFATDGVFLCGLSHYPKPIDEAVAQGKAAASRAVTLLAQGTVTTSGEIASVNPPACSGCGICVSVCPYSAPSFIAEDARFHAGKSEINPALCKGCGLCVSSCRSGAISLKGFDNDQIFAMIDAA